MKFGARMEASPTTWEQAPKSEESLVLYVFFSVFLLSRSVSGLIFFSLALAALEEGVVNC